MTQNSKIVDDIRSFLRGERTFTTEQVLALAHQYNEACLEARVRLIECAQLLLKGHRDEAIAKADSDPSLMDLIGILEFPEVASWRTFAGNEHLPSGCSFDAAQLQLLEGEYAKSSTIEPLVNEYRRACIKGSPTAERIRLLRRLRTLDPANAAWRADLVALEATWFKEVAYAIANERAAFSESQALKVLRSLQDPVLIAPAPKELVAAYQSLYNELKTTRFLDATKHLACATNDAYGAMDEAVVEQTLRQLDTLAATDQLPIPDGIVESVRDARHWLAERQAAREKQRQFQEACAALERLLEHPTTAADIQRLIGVIDTMGQDMPEHLAERAPALLRTLQLEEHRRARLKFYAIVAAALLVVAAAGSGTWLYLDHAETLAVAKQILELKDRRDFRTGEKFIQQLRATNPRRAEASVIVTASREFDKANTNNQKRAAELAELTAKADAMTEGEEGFAELCARAESLIRESTEREGWEAARSHAKTRQAERYKQADASILPVMEKVGDTLTRCHAAAISKEIERLAREANELLEQARKTPGISPGMSERIASLVQRTSTEFNRASETRKTEVERARKRDKYLAELTAARESMPAMTRYADACVALESKYPEEPETKGCADLKRLARSYESVLAFSDAIRQGVGRFQPSVSIIGPKEFSKWTGDLKLSTNLPGQQALDLASKRAKAVNDFNSNAEGLQKLLAHPMFAHVTTIEVEGRGKKTTFYSPDDAGLDLNSTHFKFFDKEHQVMSQNIFVQGGEKIRRIGTAPHSALSAKLAEVLQREGADLSWNSHLPEMLALVCSATDANARARVMIFQKLLALNTALGNPAGLEEDVQSKIDDLADKSVNFLAPSSELTVQTQLLALEGELRLFTSRIQTMMKKNTTSPQLSPLEFAALVRPVHVAGFAYCSTDGQWQVQLTGPEPRELWVLDELNGAVSYRIVALVRDKKVTWIDAAPRLISGLPLLAPDDNSDTRELLAKLNNSSFPTAPIAGWPTNIAKLPVKEKP